MTIIYLIDTICQSSRAHSHTSSICVAGVIYCHEMEGDCENATVPSPGGSCSYGDRDIPPGELTRIVSDDEDENECTVW